MARNRFEPVPGMRVTWVDSRDVHVWSGPAANLFLLYGKKGLTIGRVVSKTNNGFYVVTLVRDGKTVMRKTPGQEPTSEELYISTRNLRPLGEDE